MITRYKISVALVCVSALGAFGTSATLAADTATFGMSLGENPCDVVTASMIAKTFDVPKGKLEQSHLRTSECSYEMESDDMTLNVEVKVDTYDTDEDAVAYFRNATRSMSAEEISDAMRMVKKQAEKERNPETDAKLDTAGVISSGLLGNGIQFEEVNDIAEQARFSTGDGALHIQQGNLLITLSAFYGPAMPMPEKITAKSIQTAVKTWHEDTMTERKNQAVDLARSVLAAL